VVPDVAAPASTNDNVFCVAAALVIVAVPVVFAATNPVTPTALVRSYVAEALPAKVSKPASVVVVARASTVSLSFVPAPPLAEVSVEPGVRITSIVPVAADASNVATVESRAAPIRKSVPVTVTVLLVAVVALFRLDKRPPVPPTIANVSIPVVSETAPLRPVTVKLSVSAVPVQSAPVSVTFWYWPLVLIPTDVVEAKPLTVSVSAVVPTTEELATFTVVNPVKPAVVKLLASAAVVPSITLILAVVMPVVVRPAALALLAFDNIVRFSVPPAAVVTVSVRPHVLFVPAVTWSIIAPTILEAVVTVSIPVVSVKVEPVVEDAALATPAATTVETEAFNAAVAVAAVKEAAVESTDAR